MKNQNLINTITKGVLTAAIVAVAVPFPGAAWAQATGDLASTVSTVHSGLSSIPQIVAGAFYIGGAALTGAGLLQLKAHAENPGQNPLGKALGRLVAGCGLLALPAMANWLNNSVGLGTSAFTESTFGTLN